tara:strand:+ start:47 stop:316 length:270 start_codon:yes stop_codon:yes gene_type:complete
MKNKGYSSEQARKELMRALAELDYSFFRDGNVYYAEKAFIVNSIISYGIKKRAKGVFSLHELKYYVSLVQGFIEGEFDLAWKDGKIEKI